MGIPAKNQSNCNLVFTVNSIHLVGRCAGAEVVDFDKLGCPVSLLGCGHHFADAEKYRGLPNAHIPMDDMIQRVKDLRLTCQK